MNKFGVKWLEKVLSSRSRVIARDSIGERLTQRPKSASVSEATVRNSAQMKLAHSQELGRETDEPPSGAEFEKVIADLEKLLTEALITARAAEERASTGEIAANTASDQPEQTLQLNSAEPRIFDRSFKSWGQPTGEVLATPWAQPPHDPTGVERSREPSVSPTGAAQLHKVVTSQDSTDWRSALTRRRQDFRSRLLEGKC